jgi:protein-tyrosine phosphatase/membrane-associated phospholipid phosphatase
MTDAVARVPVQPWGRAAAWLAFLGPFFFATYGFATWVTGTRAEVGAIVFAWERSIPFVPWTIVPYWSIDLLYGLSLFVCADRRALDTHALRLLTAQVVAVALFLLFPLRFTFDRAAAGGLFGWMFEVLAGFDRPFNQAPSLHIALLVILWACYDRALGPVARTLLRGWFALIGLSVLTTWQHHFIDVPTGALLGFFCLWLWPTAGPTPMAAFRWTRDPVRRRLAARYLAGAVVVAGGATALGGAALWLFWLAVALLLVAAGYAVVGPAVFQKTDGRLSVAATTLLAPYLVGAWVNSRLWTWRRPAPVAIADGVWLGRVPSPRCLERLAFAGVVDLCAELPVAVGGRAYVGLPVLDLTVPDAATLALAALAIERGRGAGKLLVCCALGYARSACALATWLVASGRAPDARSALDRIADGHARVALSPAHVAAIDAAGSACSLRGAAPR